MAWKKVAKDTVALLSAEAGRKPTIGASRTSSGSCPPEAAIRVSGRSLPPRAQLPSHQHRSCQHELSVTATPIAQSETATFANGWLTKMIKARLHSQQSGPD